MNETKQLRLLAERIIENLEQRALPKTAHAEREDMISEVHWTLTRTLTAQGFVRIVKPE